MNKVYILYLEMFNEWACDNGGCDIVGVYSSKEKALDVLKTRLIVETDKLGNYIEDIDINSLDVKKENISVRVYGCEYDKDNDIEDGCYHIEEKELL